MRKNTNLDMGQWKARVSDLFTDARMCRRTHGEILTMLSGRIYPELNRCTAGGRPVYTSYMKGYVYGLIDAQRDQIMRNEVEFCYLVDGVLYTTSKRDTGKPSTEVFYAANRGHVLTDAPSAHYWIGTEKKYTGE